MERNFTPLLNYFQIDTSRIDLIADAFGLESELNYILPAPGVVCIMPDNELIKCLLENID